MSRARRHTLAHAGRRDRGLVVKKGPGGRSANAAIPCAPDVFERLRAEADVVITGAADCGSCTAYSVHDTVELERCGIPTVLVTTTKFRPDRRRARRRPACPRSARSSSTIRSAASTGHARGRADAACDERPRCSPDDRRRRADRGAEHRDRHRRSARRAPRPRRADGADSRTGRVRRRDRADAPAPRDSRRALRRVRHAPRRARIDRDGTARRHGVRTCRSTIRGRRLSGDTDSVPPSRRDRPPAHDDEGGAPPSRPGAPRRPRASCASASSSRATRRTRPTRRSGGGSSSTIRSCAPRSPTQYRAVTVPPVTQMLETKEAMGDEAGARISRSILWLAEHLRDVPVIVFPCYDVAAAEARYRDAHSGPGAARRRAASRRTR